MRKSVLTITSLALFLFSTVVLSDTREKLADCSQVGRYQASSTFSKKEGWVFVTVIDTTTGRVVSQKRYEGKSSYTKQHK